MYIIGCLAHRFTELGIQANELYRRAVDGSLGLSIQESHDLIALAKAAVDALANDVASIAPAARDPTGH